MEGSLRVTDAAAFSRIGRSSLMLWKRSSGTLAQTAEHQARYIGGSIERRGLALADGREHRVHVLARERTPAAEQFIENHAEGENIGAGIHDLAGRLFGRHVGGSAAHVAHGVLHGFLFVRGTGGVTCDVGRRGKHRLQRRTPGRGRQTGHPKIKQLQPIATHQHIGRLQIAMDNAARVGRIQGRCDLRRELQRRGFGERTAQWNAIHVFHHQVVRADVVDGADVGMIERGDGPDLAVEALNEHLGNHFDGDIAPHAGVGGAVDLAHATFANGRDQPVWPEPVTWKQHRKPV